MATETFMVCDNCTRKEPITAPTVWLKVVPMLTSGEAAASLLAERGQSGLEYLQRTADGGEFCSLECLGAWAFARHSLKALDEELGEVPGDD
jgi:hypothetical protein